MAFCKKFVTVLALMALSTFARAGRGLTATSTSERHFKVINESGEKVSVEWVDPNDGHRVPLGAPTSGQSVDINSFVNHTFVIRSKAAIGDQNVTEEFYQVTDDEIQIIVVKGGLVLDQTIVHDLHPASTPTSNVQDVKDNDDDERLDISSDCRAIAERRLKQKLMPASDVLDLLSECLTENAAEVIVERSDELVLEAALRKEMSRLAENYTCADTTKEVSPPIEIRTWNHKGVDREVHVLHERESSKIHMLKDFISEEECKAIEAAAAPTLHRGTVADGKGGSKMSQNRKAWQAGVKVSFFLLPC